MTDFLSAYMDYHREFCDAPDEYGEVVGLTVLAAACGNKSYVRGVGRKLYPNLWVMILGPSGKTRKSSAIDVGVDLLRAAGKIVYPSEFSTEALLGFISANPCGLFAWREYKAIASLWANQSYAAGAKALLSDLYDSPSEYKRLTQSAGEVTITLPALSILAASSMDWFYESLQSGDCGGGWLARFLVVPAADRTRFKSLVGDPPAYGAKDEAREALVAAANWDNELSITPHGRSEFAGWEVDFDRRASTIGESAATMYRLGPAALKIAFLEARSRLASAIDVQDVQRAIERIERLAKLTIEFYSGDGTATGRDAVNRRRIVERIKATELQEIEHGALLKSTGMNARQVSMAMETLVQRGTVAVVEREADDGPATTWYVLIG